MGFAFIIPEIGVKVSKPKEVRPNQQILLTS